MNKREYSIFLNYIRGMITISECETALSQIGSKLTLSECEDIYRRKKFMYEKFRLLLNATNNEIVDEFIADVDAHARLVQLTMQWITYSYPCLPFDERGKKVRDNAWKLCRDYAKTHELKLPKQPQCLGNQEIMFFNRICGK